PEAVLARLYQQTDLQTNFGAILLAIVNGQPRQLTLRQLLQEFLDFREVTLTRRYNYELQAAERRCHIVQGLMLALTNLDTAIDILRNAPDGTTAKQTFQVRLNLSESQADAILAMPMRRLTGMERQNLQSELDELMGNIQELQRLLSDRRELLKALKKELRSLKRKYADERRTKFANGTGRARTAQTQPAGKKNAGVKPLLPATISPNLLPDIEPEETIVEFSHKQYVRRLPAAERPRSKSREKSVSALEKNEDFIVTANLTKTDRTLVVLIPNGKAYPLKVADIPSSSQKDRGTPIVSLLSPSATKESAGRAFSEITVAHFILPENSEAADLVTLTQQGKIKRLPMQEFAELTNRGVTVVKLKEDDRLRNASLSKVGDQVVVATSGGRVLRFDVDDEQLPPMGRTAQGSQVTRLRKQEQLVGCITIDREDSLVLISELGWAKRMPAGSVRLTNRGEIGTQAFRFAEPKDALVGLLRAVPGTDVKLFTSAGRLLRSTTDAIAFWGKDAPGDRVFDLNPGERIIKVISSQ
ncbi:MAG: DNA topoisomerase IV, partial [Oscillatoriales cyanobacterium]